jgi:hypothetical protein
MFSRSVTEAYQETGSFLLRPFQRLMVLWCILLLVTTHVAIAWLCLVSRSS